MNNQLDDSVYNQILVLSKKGDDCSNKEEYDEAIRFYKEALLLLPEDITNWEASTWLLVTLGNACFLSHRNEEARGYLIDATHCPGGIGNPFLHLRLGQVQYELGNNERAQDELARAYMGGGLDIFSNEDEKYLDFLKTKMQIS